ncbi:DUF2513 domain-containing protein [Sporolactobacillus terrae]|uniref:DUF2513 domain-containing protein n=1 Tax=Sporolactobacillus terrae TaxID=269673 RepID=A0A5K7WX75_9BACL|nr:DUF2513 domain-containing protein [Sporolactobacillus terrae]BBN99195.1 hypothetical protein St703_19000 [Sporolactobacillus terrae]
MKLDNDCIRDFLLTLEETHLYENVSTEHLEKYKRLNKYPKDQVLYTISKLFEAGFINGKKLIISGSIGKAWISEMTWSGHEFLNTIRSDNVWKEAKDKVSKTVGSVSLTTLSELATTIAKSMLNL